MRQRNVGFYGTYFKMHHRNLVGPTTKSGCLIFCGACAYMRDRNMVGPSTYLILSPCVPLLIPNRSTQSHANPSETPCSEDRDARMIPRRLPDAEASPETEAPHAAVVPTPLSSPVSLPPCRCCPCPLARAEDTTCPR
jgi:hypothetical protein